MAKKRLCDMVVLLPGITGSVLQKNGKDVWAISGQAAWSALTGSAIENLTLKYDDPKAEDVGDGIRATQIMPDVHLVPGLVKIDGYSATSRLITDNFMVKAIPTVKNRPTSSSFLMTGVATIARQRGS